MQFQMLVQHNLYLRVCYLHPSTCPWTSKCWHSTRDCNCYYVPSTCRSCNLVPRSPGVIHPMLPFHYIIRQMLGALVIDFHNMENALSSYNVLITCMLKIKLILYGRVDQIRPTMGAMGRMRRVALSTKNVHRKRATNNENLWITIHNGTLYSQSFLFSRFIDLFFVRRRDVSFIELVKEKSLEIEWTRVYRGQIYCGNTMKA